MLALIRVRGNVKVRRDVEETLQMLGLKTVNNCVLVPINPSYTGMVEKVKDLITYGNVHKDVFKKMLLRWGRTLGNKKVDEKYLKEKGYTLEKFVDEFFDKKVKLQDLDIKPVFRLHPPRKGYEGIKRPYSLGGALGNRSNDINELLYRMI